MTPIPNSTSGSRLQPADVQMLERFSRAAVGLRAALLPRVPTRFMLKYTLRAAHLKIGGVDLDLAVEDDVLPLGLTWLSRSGSNGKSGTVLSETNGHYSRHLAMIFPSRSQLASQQITRTGRAEAVTKEGLPATLLPARQPDQMGQCHPLRPVCPRSRPGPLRNGSLCFISTRMWALPFSVRFRPFC